MATIGEIVRKTTEFFQSKSETARLDAELLIGKALGLERLQLFLKHDQALSEVQLERCRELVRRRSKGEPVAYILGEKGFYKHTFEVTAATLIPRPETEMLVIRGLEILESRLPARGARAKSAVQKEIAAAQARRAETELAAERAAALAEATHLGLEADEIGRALEAAPELVSGANDTSGPAITSPPRPPITIVDLGCGSGCIGLSIGDEIKDRCELRLILVDVSADAIEVAKRNAKNIGLATCCEFVVADAGDINALENLKHAADLVVANPPYIDPADTRVEAGVKAFEPAGALFAGAAGESGIAEIRRWSTIARKLARAIGSVTTGAVLFEIGDGQGDDSVRIFNEAGWDHVKLARDLSNRERMVEARASVQSEES